MLKTKLSQKSTNVTLWTPFKISYNLYAKFVMNVLEVSKFLGFIVMSFCMFFVNYQQWKGSEQN